MELNNLNDFQKEAVKTTEGPLMVVAGAGSGKTRVLTHRIAYLIEELNIDKSNILAVTFTNKAAREMKERVNSLTHIDTKNMWVMTFHSFCARLLRMEIDKLEGYKKDFVIIDEDDQAKVLRDVLKELNLDSKEFKPKYLIKLISDKKNDDLKEIKDPYLKNKFIDIYNNYNKALLKDSLLDFDDLITLTLKLFKEKEEVLEKYQDKFKYILVDEFQDTNKVQYELVKLLAKKHKNIFIVGDQDQSIYSFRGAKVTNIDLFQKDFSDLKTIILEENYRSTNDILDLANKVISNNPNRIKKNLFTKKLEGVKPYYYKAQSSYDETMFVLDKIKELKRDGYGFEDFAIIYRNNALSRPFEDLFVKYNIPYEIYGGLSFFERKEIKDMIAYLRLMLNHNDDFSFKRIINEPKRKIGPAVIEKLNMSATKNRTSLYEAIDFTEVSGPGANSLIDFKFTMLEFLEYFEDPENEFNSIIDLILDQTGYEKMLKDLGDDGENKLENIKELKSVLKETEEFYEGTRREKLETFLLDLALRTESDNIDDSSQKVKLMTYHQAKGLEFKVVFLVALEQGIFPSINCTTFSELEEERRVCYVGITRAKERLFITNAKSRYVYGQFSNQIPSSYIKEMGLTPSIGYKEEKEIDDFKQNNKKESSIKKVEYVDNSAIKVGDKINHQAFGDGIVVEDNGRIITVAFSSPTGIKKMAKDHPSIRKI